MLPQNQELFENNRQNSGKVYGRLFPFVISEYHIEKCGKCTRTIQCLYYVLICKHQHKHPPFRKGSKGARHYCADMTAAVPGDPGTALVFFILSYCVNFVKERIPTHILFYITFQPPLPRGSFYTQKCGYARNAPKARVKAQPHNVDLFYYSSVPASSQLCHTF